MRSAWEQGPSSVPVISCRLAWSPAPAALTLPGTLTCLVRYSLNPSCQSCPVPLETLCQGLSLVVQSRVLGGSQVPLSLVMLHPLPLSVPL